MTLVRLQREPWADPAMPLPHYATEGAAGADLRANLRPDDRTAGITLAPFERRVIPTGFLVEIAPGHELQIRPRSGLALRHGLTLPNSPGTIDCDYRGPLGVLLVNLGTEPVTIRHGERIAQAILAPVLRARFEEVAALTPSARGTGGFGSTGRD